MARQGAKIVGVTDWKGGVHNPKGLDVAKLIAHVKQHKTVARLPRRATRSPPATSSSSTPRS